MRLDEACSFVVDCEHKTAPIDEKGHHFAVGTPAMRGHRLNYDEARRISEDTFDAWTRRLRPRGGDLLLAREAPVGSVVQVPESANVAPGQRTVLLRPDSRITDSRFLYYSLISPAAQIALLVKAEGSTVHHLNVKDIRSFDVWIPSLSEQQAIAEVLGALDDKIAANTRLAGSVVEESRWAYKGALAAGGAEYFTLGAIARHQAGKYLAKDQYRSSGSLPVFGSNSIMGTHDRPNVNGPFLVLARIGSYCGALRWSQADAWVNNNASALVPLNDGESYLLRFAAEEIDMGAHRAGTGQPYIRIDSLMDETIRLPRFVDRVRLSEQIRVSGEFEVSLSEENRTLAATRDALLPKLMSGQLRVRDAEKIVESAGA